ncbi:pseudouridine synthase [Methylophilales bacterium MBRSG12]|uniref:Pseudouridine synthase n=1 Tax=Methylophilales bacterium MBRS-H7 TaxID=1623450 RepID=A0A0H4J3Q8_9PROT|nr:pseudouridine synthase [Methylophilales bacterium MBRSF5]AKO66373.1 pseudouridine synthase [Methylophilales bacterium MBRS-H7]AKO67688.1 pseudouridine synthase [Methylophilales bacterium MBRSG12]
MQNKQIQYIDIDESSEDQRIDNFLFKTFKDVPKNHIFKIIRNGEVRVNKKRIKTLYKLKIHDVVRIPPIEFIEKKERKPSSKFKPHIIFEDEWLLVVDKPSGLAVHGGSGIDFGLIERMRHLKSEYKFLELVHRIDKNTSGVIVIAKKRSALRSMQELFRNKKIKKNYLVAVKGNWDSKKKEVSLRLEKKQTPEGHHVNVVEDPLKGKLSKSIFYLVKQIQNKSLLSAQIITGRTHQIRVQLAFLGFPVLGDDKYGDFALNKKLHSSGLKRMFLHAHKLSFFHPFTNEKVELTADLPLELGKFFDE